ncbi:MAG: selenocysteine-specific translation elongation factor [Henriciella sp.]
MDKTIAIIGHVDHGKTSLVKALTGTETDRLAEEQKRGLSIILGFANTKTEGGYLHFIDAPGHSDFIQTAAAGLSGADAILLVVSAVEGVAPQTVEHLRLARLFGIQDTVVALTKSDLMDEKLSSPAIDGVSQLLNAFGFPAAPVIPCSSATGDGIEPLKTALQKLTQTDRSRPEPDCAFLPIDRVFTADGAGTIVTGTLLGGDLQIDQPITLQPAGHLAAVRGLQIDGRSVDRGTAGNRVAVNLRNISAKNVKPGDTLCGSDLFLASERFDVALDQPSRDSRPLRHMEEVTALFGTRHCSARVRLFAPTEHNSVAQLEFKSPQIAFGGQRFILRRPATAETVAGGRILDPQARLVTRQKALHIQVLEAAQQGDLLSHAELMAERDRGCVDLSTLSRLARCSVDACQTALAADFIFQDETTAFSRAHIEAMSPKLVEVVAAFHAERPMRPHMPQTELEKEFRQAPKSLLDLALQTLIAQTRIERRADGVALPSHAPMTVISDEHLSTYVATQTRLLKMGLTPTPLFDDAHMTGDQEDMIELMLWSHDAVRLYNHALKQSLLLHSESIRQAIRTLEDSFPDARPFTTSEARQVLKTNRKTVVPLLEHFDDIGFTKRDGNLRTFQPRTDQE